MNSTQQKLQWNILVSALSAGRKAKLGGYMDVLSANNDLIIVNNSGVIIKFNKAEIVQNLSKPRLCDFTIEYQI